MIDIIDAYLEPHRHYHNLTHISNMLENSRYFHLTEIDMIKLKYAIYFHDYVYDPESKMNEKNSAIAFLDYVNSGKIQLYDIMPTKDFTHAVFNMILDTKEHVPSIIGLSKYLIDLDLWELADTAKYWKNLTLIRKEYSIYFYDEFVEGRIKWINHFLSKEQIFYTDYCINNDFENLARINLNDELKGWV